MINPKVAAIAGAVVTAGTSRIVREVIMAFGAESGAVAATDAFVVTAADVVVVVAHCADLGTAEGGGTIFTGGVITAMLGGGDWW
jgi:FAD/FMN-containing dehydrogenase